MCNPPRLGRGASRRDVLRFTLAGAGLAALGPLGGRLLPAASGAVATQTTFLILNAFGGNDALNMVVPTGLQAYYDRRPTIHVPVAQQLALTGGPRPTTAYALHPRMTRIQGLWNQGQAAIVNLVGYPQANESHFESEDIWSSAFRQGAGGLTVPHSGWIARYADRNAASPLGVLSVGIGRRRDFAGGTTNPLQLGRLRDFRFLSDGSYAANHLHRLEAVRQVLSQQPTTGLSGEARASLDAAHQLVDQVQAAITSYTSAVTYPGTGLASSLKDVARLVQAGFPTRVFYTGFGGFDTHGDQASLDAAGLVVGSHANLLDTLDKAVGALVDDLTAMGAWDRTVIAVISEFGRRNYENGSLGTDHAAAQAVLVLGGAVRGGVYGPDLTDAMLAEEVLDYAVDFRDVYREILADHLGASGLAEVFPETQEVSTTLGLL